MLGLELVVLLAAAVLPCSIPGRLVGQALALPRTVAWAHLPVDDTAHDEARLSAPHPVD